MKVSDFKLLTTLPEEYDYEFFTLNNRQAVIGKQHQTIIGFYIHENKLTTINFSSEPTNRS